MRIAQLAPTFERVPPRTYGGTELVVGLITEELVARGHEVTLFATGDSRTSAPAPERHAGARSATARRRADGLTHAEYLQLANAQACFLAAADGEFDLVHNHAGVEGMVLGAIVRHARRLDDAQPVPARGRSPSGTPTRGSTTRSPPRARRRSRPPARCRRSSTGSTSRRSAPDVRRARDLATPTAISCSSAGSARRRAPTGRSRRLGGPGGASSSPARSIPTT